MTRKRETIVVDRAEIARALMSPDGKLDQDTITRLADAMIATAKAVLINQSFAVRITRSRGTDGRSSHEDMHQRLLDGGRSSQLLQGQGLPEAISSAEGISRLRARAVKVPIEKWAGEVLGPTKAAERLGIRRSTLANWRNGGEIIALPKGKTAHVIPMAQFVENRPLPGVGRVLKIAHGSASLAWHWLTTPHVDFGDRPPLHALFEGQEEDVCAAAERSIG